MTTTEERIKQLEAGLVQDKKDLELLFIKMKAIDDAKKEKERELTELKRLNLEKDSKDDEALKAAEKASTEIKAQIEMMKSFFGI